MAWLLLASLALTVISVTACTHDAGAVKVVSVTDGDTIRVVLQGREEPVRLIGINTPELRPRPAPYAREAHAHLQELVAGRRVWLEFDVTERDRYGRMLAYVWLKPPGGARDARAEMVNAAMLLAGWAEVLEVRPNTKYAVLFLLLQDEAKAARRGRWRDTR
jgi:micrococcal nuclease